MQVLSGFWGCRCFLPGYQDNKEHLLLSCQTFDIPKKIVDKAVAKLEFPIKFQKISNFFCFVNNVQAKQAYKYIKILFTIRNKMMRSNKKFTWDMKVGVLKMKFVKTWI